MARPHGDGIPSVNAGTGSSSGTSSTDFLQEIRSTLDRTRADVEGMVNERLNTHERFTGPCTPGNSGGRPSQGRRTRDYVPGQVNDVLGYRAFRQCGAQEFTGVADAVESYDWIYDIEQVFSLSKTSEEDKVSYAAGMLKRSARIWWRNEYTMMAEERRRILTWEVFKEKFLAKYCPRDIQRRIAREFLDLKQGDMSVAAYETEFRRKMTFAGHYASSEEDRVERFIEGLRIDIREKLDDKDVGSLEEAVRLARRREYILEIKDAELHSRIQGNQSDNRNLNSLHSKLLSSRKSSFRKPFCSKYPSFIQFCRRCRIRRSKVCNRKISVNSTPNDPNHLKPFIPTMVCYRCGTVGHTRRVCPQRRSLQYGS